MREHAFQQHLAELTLALHLTSPAGLADGVLIL
jgi:hypothetical protein